MPPFQTVRLCETVQAGAFATAAMAESQPSHPPFSGDPSGPARGRDAVWWLELEAPSLRRSVWHPYLLIRSIRVAWHWQSMEPPRKSATSLAATSPRSARSTSSRPPDAVSPTSPRGSAAFTSARSTTRSTRSRPSRTGRSTRSTDGDPVPGDVRGRPLQKPLHVLHRSEGGPRDSPPRLRRGDPAQADGVPLLFHEDRCDPRHAPARGPRFRTARSTPDHESV